MKPITLKEAMKRPWVFIQYCHHDKLKYNMGLWPARVYEVKESIWHGYVAVDDLVFGMGGRMDPECYGLYWWCWDSDLDKRPSEEDIKQAIKTARENRRKNRKGKFEPEKLD